MCRERKERLVARVRMVLMVLLESPEKMVPLVTQDVRDHLVIKAVMQLSEIAVDAHQAVLPKASKVVPVNQESLVYLATLAQKVPVVNLVGVFLVTVESLEKMVNQAMMELMVNLVNQVSLEDLEMLLALRSQHVQISSLT